MKARVCFSPLALAVSTLVLICVADLCQAQAVPTTGLCWTPADGKAKSINLDEACPYVKQKIAKQIRVDYFLPVNHHQQSWIVVAITNGLYRLNVADFTTQNMDNLTKSFTDNCPFRRDIFPFLCTSTLSLFHHFPNNNHLFYCNSNHEAPVCKVKDVVSWLHVNSSTYPVLDGVDTHGGYSSNKPFSFIPVMDPFPMPSESYFHPTHGIVVALSEQLRLAKYNSRHTTKFVSASAEEKKQLFFKIKSRTVVVGSFPIGDKWYMVVNRLKDNYDQVLVYETYIARVCLSDKGKAISSSKYSELHNVLQAQIVCEAVKNEEKTLTGSKFQYSSVVSIDVFVDNVGSTTGDTFVYAAFSVSPTARYVGTQRGSAICAYAQNTDQKGIENAFTAKPLEAYLTSARAGPTANIDGSCNKSTTHSFLKKTIKNPQQPLYYDSRDVITAIALTECKTFVTNTHFNVILIAHANGSLTKLLTISLAPSHVIETFSAVTVAENVNQITKIKFQSKITDATDFVYVQTKLQLMRFPLARCSLRKSCRECVAMRDPFCGWHMGSCNSNSSGLQSVGTGDTSKCPQELPEFIIPPILSNDIESTVVQFSIRPKTPTTSYDLQNISFNIYLNGSHVLSTAKEVTKANITGLTPFTWYSLDLVPVDGFEPGNRSASVLFTTKSDYPDRFTIHVASRALKTSVTNEIAWIRPTIYGIPSHYMVYYSFNGSDSFQLLRNITTNLTDLSWRLVHADVIPNSSYSYTVVVCTQPFLLCTTANATEIKSQCLLPALPKGLRVKEVSAYNITLVWDETPMGVSHCGVFFYPNIIPVDGHCNDATSTFIITRLQAKTQYQFVMQAQSCGGSNLSQPIDVTTADGPPPVPILYPPVFSADPAGPHISLNWTLESGRRLGTLLPMKVCREPPFSPTQSCIMAGNASTQTYSDANLSSHTATSACVRFKYTIVSATLFGEQKSAEQSVYVAGKLPAVLSLNASAQGPNVMVLSWKPPNIGLCQVSKYELTRGAKKVELCCSGSQTQFTDMSLAPFSQYTYSITALSSFSLGVDDVSHATVTANTTSARPGKPDNLTASVRDDILLRWDVPSSPNGEITNYSIARDSVLIASTGRENTTFHDDPSNLKGGWSYIYSVRAHTSAGAGPPTEVTVVTRPKLPQPPRGVHVTALSYTSSIVTWVPPVYRGDLEKYNIEILLVTEDGSSSRSAGNITTEGNRTSATFTSMTNGETYVARVTAESAAGRSRSADSVPMALPVPIPDIPISQSFNMSVMSLVPLSIYASWSATKPSEILKYRLFYKCNNTKRLVTPACSDRTRVCCGSSETSHVIQGLEGDMNYTFFLSAVLLNGTVLEDVASATTTSLPYYPTQPEGLRAEHVDGTMVTLSWRAPKFQHGQYAYTEVWQNNVAVLNSTQMSANLSHLSTFTAYEFRVRSVNVGELAGPLSKTLVVKTKQGTPSPPRQLEICSLNTSTMAVRWLEPEATNGVLGSYQVWVIEAVDDSQCDSDSADNDSISIHPTDHLAVIFGLKEGQVYCVNVRCVNTGSVTSNWTTITGSVGPGSGIRSNGCSLQEERRQPTAHTFFSSSAVYVIVALSCTLVLSLVAGGTGYILRGRKRVLKMPQGKDDGIMVVRPRVSRPSVATSFIETGDSPRSRTPTLSVPYNLPDDSAVNPPAMFPKLSLVDRLSPDNISNSVLKGVGIGSKLQTQPLCKQVDGPREEQTCQPNNTCLVADESRDDISSPILKQHGWTTGLSPSPPPRCRTASSVTANSVLEKQSLSAFEIYGDADPDDGAQSIDYGNTFDGVGVFAEETATVVGSHDDDGQIYETPEVGKATAIPPPPTHHPSEEGNPSQGPFSSGVLSHSKCVMTASLSSSLPHTRLPWNTAANSLPAVLHQPEEAAFTNMAQPFSTESYYDDL